MAFPRSRQCSGWFTRNPESSALCHPFRLCPATTRASADFGVSFQVNESSTIPRKVDVNIPYSAAFQPYRSTSAPMPLDSTTRPREPRMEIKPLAVPIAFFEVTSKAQIPNSITAG